MRLAGGVRSHGGNMLVRATGSIPRNPVANPDNNPNHPHAGVQRLEIGELRRNKKSGQLAAKQVYVQEKIRVKKKCWKKRLKHSTTSSNSSRARNKANPEKSASLQTSRVPESFWWNERYTCLNLAPTWRN